MSHNTQILNYLKPPGRKIDPMKALRMFDCWALSSRISELIKQGNPIKAKLVKNKKGKIYAEYFL